MARFVNITSKIGKRDLKFHLKESVVLDSSDQEDSESEKTNVTSQQDLWVLEYAAYKKNTKMVQAIRMSWT